MSDKSDGLSEVSMPDVSEGIEANKVYQSQRDQSILINIQATKSILSEEIESKPKELNKNETKSPKGSIFKQKKLRYAIPIKFNPDSFECPLPVETPKQKRKIATNMISQNIKNIKRIQKPSISSPVNSSKFPKRICKKSQIDIEGRFYDYKRKSIEKLEKKRLEPSVESEECTFHPKTNSSHRSRSFNDFYKDIMKYKNNKDSKIKQLQDQQSTESKEEFDFSPRICKRSSMLTPKNRDVSCFERLYTLKRNHSEGKLSEKKLRKDLINGTFKSHQASNIQLDNNKEKRLKYHGYSEKNPPKKHFTVGPLKKSLDILIESFIKDFETQSNLHDSKATGKFNYLNFLNILRNLRFYKEKPDTYEIILVLEIWQALGGERGFIFSDDLKVYLMSIMGYYKRWMKNNPSLPINKDSVGKIHAKYSSLFKNRNYSHFRVKSLMNQDKEPTNNAKQRKKLRSNTKEPEKSNKSFNSSVNSDKIEPILNSIIHEEYPTKKTCIPSPPLKISAVSGNLSTKVGKSFSASNLPEEVLSEKIKITANPLSEDTLTVTISLEDMKTNTQE